MTAPTKTPFVKTRTFWLLTVFLPIAVAIIVYGVTR